MARVLVTGGSGWIGSAVTARLLTEVDGEVWQMSPSEDVTEWGVVESIRRFDPDVVFHLAAKHFIPWCERNPRETIVTNAIATGMIAAAVEPRAFVLASSASVYGLAGTSGIRFGEDSMLEPVDVYGRSKVLAEDAIRTRAEQVPGRWVAARIFNVVGPEDPTPHLVPNVRDAFHRGVKEAWIDATTLQDERDYVHIEDVSRALVQLAEVAPEGFTPVNICTGVGTSVGEVLNMHGLRPMDDPKRRRGNGGGHLVGDPQRFVETLGWIPRARPIMEDS